MKIIESTTLADLAIEASKLGATFISIKPKSLGGFHVGVMFSTEPDWIMGEGVTIAESLDACFQLKIKTDGDRLNRLSAWTDIEKK